MKVRTPGDSATIFKISQLHLWAKRLLLIVYLYYCFLMLGISWQYISFRHDVAFLAIKQQYVHLMHYRFAFFLHVFSALFVLPAGFTQFSDSLRRYYPNIHKRMGWLYILVTLLLAGPSGLIIGMYANGGPFSQLAFCLLAVLWMLFTAAALMRILQKNIPAHKAWMMRSFALALSAITLRAWKYLLVAMFHPKPMDVYQVVAWLGWTLNLLLAECWIIYKFKNAYKTSF